MTLEEKIIASGFMFIFSIAVWFTSHPKSMNGFANPSKWWWGVLSLLFNKDGTEKRYTKLIVSLLFILWGISFWLFPELWSHKD
jgi:hypothetical protein